MKRLWKGLLVCCPAVLLLLSASCRKDPVFQSVVVKEPYPTASFAYVSDTANHLIITFSNTSQNTQSVYWKFGDGTTSDSASPVHTYPASGRYNVTLITRSPAGYSADTTMKVIAAAPAKAGFSTNMSGVWVKFNNTSVSIDSVKWNFGDNTATSDSLAPIHVYSAAGTYPVTLTEYGIGGDTSVLTQTITVNYNCISGGNFGTTDATNWIAWNQQNNNPPVFGYTGDPSFGGTEGCLEFPSFIAPSNGSTNELIYQRIYVQAGKRYQFSAQVKLPAGGSQCYMQFYLSNDPNTWNENNGQSPTQLFMSFNTWHGWGGYSGSGPTVACEGSVTHLVHQFGDYGPYAALNGVYTATTTGFMYLGMQAGSWEGRSGGSFLVDSVSFVQLP